MNAEQKSRYDKLVKDLVEFDGNNIWSSFLEQENKNYNAALVDLDLTIENLIFYKEIFNPKESKIIEFYRECYKEAEELYDEVDWDEKCTDDDYEIWEYYE